MKCQNCGSPYTSDDKFCNYCGSRIEVKQSETKPTANNSDLFSEIKTDDSIFVSEQSLSSQPTHQTNEKEISFVMQLLIYFVSFLFAPWSGIIFYYFLKNKTSPRTRKIAKVSLSITIVTAIVGFVLYMIGNISQQ